MKYRTIVVDPPWAYRVSSLPPSSKAKAGHRSRAAAENYTTMSHADLLTLPLREWAEDEAHLYLWTTNAFMVEAHDLAKAWGFEQKTILTWVKPNIGMGHWFRNTTEHVLFAVRGKLAGLHTNCRTDFTAPRGRHSTKPAAFYDLVESMSPGPYLDVFARKQRMVLHGPNAGELWATWGNECFVADGLPEPTRQIALPAVTLTPAELEKRGIVELGGAQSRWPL